MSPSIWQILIVVGLILLFFGPKRIPGLGKSLGEAIRGFKKGISDDEIDVTPEGGAQPAEKIQASESSGEDKKQSQKKKESNKV